MYSQATSLIILDTSSKYPSELSSSITIPSPSKKRRRKNEKKSPKANSLADYGDDLQKIKRDEQEREKLREYTKFMEDFCSRPRMPLTYNKIRSTLIPEKIQRLCLKALLDREAKKLPSEEDLNRFTSSLGTSVRVKNEEIEGRATKTISFGGLNSILHDVNVNSIISILQPLSFFRAHFPEWNFQADYRVPVDAVVEFLSLKVASMRNRINMAYYDPEAAGYLTRGQLCEYYLKEVIPRVDVLKELEETFKICYLNTVESMFFFFLDSKHTGRIRISDALVSGFLENAFGLQANSEDYENWFSPEKTHELNALFQMFDSKHKNYFDKSDFKQIQDGTFTQTFVDRLFETHVAKAGEAMSYEEFVIFQIAYNHLAHPASIAYFFKVLDVDGDNFLTRFELRYFYTDLCKAYNGWMAMEGAMPEFDDIVNQFFDMIKPIEDGKISLEELLSCKQGHDFILCLINYQEFYRYETRDAENGAAMEQDSSVPVFGDLGGEDEEKEGIKSGENASSSSEDLSKNAIVECNNNSIVL